jgi:hypothetical protein
VNAAPHRVAILVYDGVTLLDVAGPAEVFKEANRFGAHYRIVLLSPTGANVTSSLGVRIAVDGAVSSEQAFAIDAVRRLLESIHPARMAPGHRTSRRTRRAIQLRGYRRMKTRPVRAERRDRVATADAHMPWLWLPRCRHTTYGPETLVGQRADLPGLS